MKMLRVIALLLANNFLAQAPLAQQPNAPVATAFRTTTQRMQRKLLLAAEAMPATKYAFRASRGVRSFGETVWWLWDYNAYLCARVGGAPVPRETPLSERAPKDSLVAGLRASIGLCDQMLAALDDSALGDSVEVDLRPDPIGRVPRMTRAAAMTAATVYWADIYARLSEYLRLNGIVPENPCGPAADDPHCGSGRMLCFNTRNPMGGSGFTATVGDAPYAVTSDGQGSYVFGTGNVQMVAASRAVVLVLGREMRGTGPRRGLTVDLRDPVPKGGGTPLGIVTDSGSSGPIEIAAQWYAEPDRGRRRAHSTLDIPIGKKVDAAQTDMSVHIEGVPHVLQMGPQPFNHCFSDPPTIHGRGTSRATILRADSTRWIVDLPPGSVGRLFDVRRGTSYAVDKGLYFVSMRFVIEKR